MRVKSMKYVFPPLLLLIFLILPAESAFAWPVSFTLTAEPQAVIDANPSFTLRRKVYDGWWSYHWESESIRPGQTITIEGYTECELIKPTEVDGCQLEAGEDNPESFRLPYWGSASIHVKYENCNPVITYYHDGDGDGYGDPNTTTTTSPMPADYVANNLDCDDTTADITLGPNWYKDIDGDGYTDNVQQNACTRPAGYSLASELSGYNDCNDGDASINPGAAEICNDGTDQDCDGNDICGNPYYRDADEDGYGDSGAVFYAVSQPDGYVTDSTDCDDNDAKEFPGQTWYLDADSDGYSSGFTLTACERPNSSYKTSDERIGTTIDCNDSDRTIHPFAMEICGDNIDQDCSGSDKACTSDGDGDGSPANEDCDDNDASQRPGAIEIPGDGIDQDCDGFDATAATCVDLADSPLDTQLAASPPNLMFGLDDSGSMDWEIMTSEASTTFEADRRDHQYVFADPGDNLYQTGVYSYSLQEEGRQSYWRSQWHEYNVIYYNPSVDYTPWSSTLGNADPDNPRSHPYYAANYFDLSAWFGTIDGVSIPNAHYYVWSNTDNRPYLVIVNNNAITYYKVTETGERLGNGDLDPPTTNPPADVKTSRTYAQERQNFANWYSYYRKRRSTSIAAIGAVIPRLKGVMVGIRSINAHILQKVLPVAVNGVDRSADILDKLFSYHPGTHTIGGTPLRKGLQKIGQYYHVNQSINPNEPEFATSPLAGDATGECQQNFAIMFTDGAYNGLSPGLGNVDDDYGAPYADNASNTLADVAMYYWKEDLAPAVSNNVPTNFYDSANWQHMVTYTVSFGVEGNLNQDDYDLYNIVAANRIYPNWPSPINSDAERIDDLWHTAVNGRGLYLNAKTPQELIAAFETVISDVLARIGSGASVSINGEELQEGLVLYQSIYSTNRWTGDVIAYNVNKSTGAVDRESPKWSASTVLDSSLNGSTDYWNTGRLIATYDDSTAAPAGIPFRFASLNTTQKGILPTSSMVDYLRGNHALEEQKGGTYRSRYLLDESGNYDRDTAMADIVHSAPLYYKDVIYAGANDGMLHALNSASGAEIFAYIPNLVFDHLDDLVDPNYSHKYYVDLTPYARSTGTKDLLVGGLGKGGKGYYCLDITNARTAIGSESALADRVLWEFPNANTSAADANDMGYSYSRAFIVNTNSSYGWVAIFGNGYNSTNHDAVLFIVDAETGTLIKKISTGAKTACNGLASPLVIDVKRPDATISGLMVNGSDGKADYIYAGDLQGNLWKFDLTSTNVADWGVAYKGTDADGATVNMPLFQAKDDFGNTQPITTKPDAMYHCQTREHGYIIVFGTGKYLGVSDLADKNQQTLYGVWDYGDDSQDNEYLGAFNRNSTPMLSNQPNSVSLLEQTVYWSGVSNSVIYRILTDNPITWSSDPDSDPKPDAYTVLQSDPSSTTQNNAGWYFDLPDEKERIVRDIVLRSGRAVVITSIPQSNAPCMAGGESYLMEVNACNGGRTSQPVLDVNEDGQIDEKDLIPVPNGNGGTDSMPPTGMKYPTMMFPPMIIDNPLDDTELKYFSTSAGNVIIMQEQDEGAGITFWRHRED